MAAWPAAPGLTNTLALHSGIHAGLVVASPGDRASGELDVVGDAANTAARLASLAPRDRILVDADSLGPELVFFEAETIELLALPGRSVPVRAITVRGLSRLQRRIDAWTTRGRSPLLGRDALLAELVQACTQAGRRRRVIEIRGPAGIGKTRLLDELAARLAAQGLVVLRGGCESYGPSPVLEPFQLLAAQPPAANLAEADTPGLLERCLELLTEHDRDDCVLLLDD